MEIVLLMGKLCKVTEFGCSETIILCSLKTDSTGSKFEDYFELERILPWTNRTCKVAELNSHEATVRENP